MRFGIMLILAALVSEAAGEPSKREHTENGLTVALTIDPASPREGGDAVAGFRIKDATGAPVGGLRPLGWVDPIRPSEPLTPENCQERIKGFVRGSLRSRPAVDLNSFFILAMNEDPTISVIDPLVGFGTTQLYTLVPLKAPAADWALTADRKTLYVSVPRANEIAAVNTGTWKIAKTIPVEGGPRALVLEGGERRLWALTATGASVVDLVKGGIAGVFPTPSAPSGLVVDQAARNVFVLAGGALQRIRTDRLSSDRPREIPGKPTHIAYSELSGAVYLAGASDGMLTVVDAETGEDRARTPLEPGVSDFRFAPGSRFGFAVVPGKKLALVVDASSNRVAHRVELEDAAERVYFSAASAYFRSRDTERIKTVGLALLGGTGQVTVGDFAGGQSAPGPDWNPGPVAEFSPSPEASAMFIPHAADQRIYYYHEGMTAPKDSFRNYGHSPRAVLAVDRNLREREAGFYSTHIRVPAAGKYAVAVIVDQPRVSHCFEVEVARDPEFRRRPRYSVVSEVTERKAQPGVPHPLRFRVKEASGQPVPEVKDLMVVAMRPPGDWQARIVAGRNGDLYEASVTLPEPGIYYVYVQAKSIGVTGSRAPVVLHVEEKKP